MLKLGYTPYSSDLEHPGDRRRFAFYAARRGLAWERADPAKRYDAVVLTARADLQRWINYDSDVPVVFDLADSYLSIPRNNLKSRLRGTAKWIAREARSPFYSYRSVLEQALRRADAVASATPEQAASIRSLCANVHPILDFQTEVVGTSKQSYGADGPINLVWEGLGTNLRWFSEIAEPLRDLHRGVGVKLHLVTQVEYREYVMRFGKRLAHEQVADLGVPTRIYQWDATTIGPICAACDIGVIPLPLDRPFESQKPENKLVLLWRFGLPVVTTATAAYVRTMAAAGQDLVCRTADDWSRILGLLVASERARREAGAGGRSFAAARYSEERLLADWDQLFGTIGIGAAA